MDATYSGHTAPVNRFAGIDRRTREWRRRAELITLLAAQVGPDLTEAQHLEVERLADLMLIAERQRVAMLAGEQIDVPTLVKVENLARRAARALDIQPDDPREIHAPKKPKKRRQRRSLARLLEAAK